MSGWMQTISGRRVYPDDLARSEFNIYDIAYGLSNLNRFGGHTIFPYSVAQHSVLVAAIVKDLGGTPAEQCLGLVHDATEAYLVDVPSPIKRFISGYKELEERFLNEIVRQLFLPSLEPYGGKLPGIVKKADAIALRTEAELLMNGETRDWPCFRDVEPASVAILEKTPAEAEREFLSKYLSFAAIPV